MSQPLSWRAEARRQLGRRRTAWIFGIVAVLPLLLVVAFAFDSGPNNRSDGTPLLVDLATGSGANFTVFTLFVSAELLLAIVAALFVGDPVPAEASWASLRYLLTAPVGRVRLLTSKLVVGFASLGLATLALPAWAAVVGLIAYGTEPFTSPSGTALGWGVMLARLAVAAGYIFLSLAPVAAIAFWIGVRSDAPLAAVGGAFLVLIVSGILDSIDALGSWRNGLPGHYSRAWLDLISGPAVDWTALRHGALWSLFWTILFLALGYRRFTRQDILS